MHRMILLLLAAVIGVGGEGPAAGAGTPPGAEDGAGRPAGEQREDAVSAGLRFLATHQSPDGMWHPVLYRENCPQEPKCESGRGGEDDAIVLTAQGLLAFLGAGYDHKSPSRHKATMQRGTEALFRRQRADGTVGATVEAQATAAMALAETYAMTGDAGLRQPAQAAIDRLLALRIPGRDGAPLVWGQAGFYDTWATLQAVQALRIAAACGLGTGDGLEAAKRWLEVVWQSANPTWTLFDPYRDVSVFPIRWSPGGSSGGSGNLPEGGAVAGIMLGRRAGDPLLETLGNAILRMPAAERFADLRRTRFAHLALYQLGGDRWQRWNAIFRDTLVQGQRRGDGCRHGSWDAQGQAAPVGERGRLESTMLAIHCLELYYCYARVPAVRK